MTKTSKQMTLFACAMAIIALCLGLWLQYNTEPDAKHIEKQLRSATVFPQPRQLNSFSIQGTNNKPFTNQNFQGHWNLVFFGFTNCPMLCPTTLAVLNHTYQELEKQRVPMMPQIVFISVDPERDSLTKIRRYLNGFNKHFLGARGTKQQIDKITQELSVIYMKVKPKDDKNPDNYTIDHSGTILIINPKGEFYGLFSVPHNFDDVAHDVETMEKNYRG